MRRPVQLPLDFSPITRPFDEEKKDNPLSFRAGDRFKDDLSMMAKAKNISLADLLYEYALQGFTADYTALRMAQLHEKKTVRELMGRS